MVLTVADDNNDWLNSVKGNGVAATLFEATFGLTELLSAESQPQHLVNTRDGWTLETTREPSGLRLHLYDTASRESLAQLCDLRPTEDFIRMLEYTPKLDLDHAERREAFEELGALLETFAKLRG